MLGTGSVPGCGRRSRVDSACVVLWLLAVLASQRPLLVLCDWLPPPRLGLPGTLLHHLLSLHHLFRVASIGANGYGHAVDIFNLLCVRASLSVLGPYRILLQVYPRL